MLKRASSQWLLVIFLLLPGPLLASDYLFLDNAYLRLTREVLDQADALAPASFDPGSSAESLYTQASLGIRQQIDTIEHAKYFKKLKPEVVAEVKDKQFAGNLNTFKFALNAMASKAGKPLAQLIPSYEKWVQSEAAVVSRGVDQRLQAFETRFGPDSEQVNFIELFTGEFFFHGDESSPSPWEPIARLSAVQLTTSGPGLVSSFELGMNHYFLKGPVPVPFKWIGLSNHFGAAATLQYLNDPRLLRFRGRPAFGFTLHLDRKEAGLSWDPDQHTVRFNLGYAFQFVPFLL